MGFAKFILQKVCVRGDFEFILRKISAKPCEFSFQNLPAKPAVFAFKLARNPANLACKALKDCVDASLC